MMPYIVGQDPETNEILIGDRRNNMLFLRGPVLAETQIRDLVQAANQWCHEREGFCKDATHQASLAIMAKSLTDRERYEAGRIKFCPFCRLAIQQ